MNRTSAALSLLFFLCTIPAARSQDVDSELRVPLAGDFASELRVTDGPWRATEPGHPLTLTFTASGLAGVKQFDLVVRLEPPDAFDATSMRFVTDSPFTNPVAGGVDKISESELKMGAAILGAAIDGERALGTLMIQTNTDFSAALAARLVIQSFSIGPTSFERNEYDESQLKLEVLVNMPTAVGVDSWGAVKAGQDAVE